MTYFYWFILKASADNLDSNTKPSIGSFSPLREHWQYLERSGRWSVQIESEVIPSEAVGLYNDLTAISRSWVNGAVLVKGEAVGGPWDSEAFPAFVAGYSLTYAHTTLIAL
ncbi:hypothetical protein [Pseudomonas poae]|uniref:hypothetical protein n=1 Tax=Pseudomonas poae TaxID=200451 RepID=UPI00114CE65F|nr:hypothetical protein [Pseudomonas poae]